METETACVSKLPDKPSALIRVALEDLEKCEKDPRYEINMGRWHERTLTDEDNPDSAKCAVCFAGVVVANRLGLTPDETFRFKAFDYETRSKLLALDEFRCGCWRIALAHMGINEPSEPLEINPFEIAIYRQDPAQFKTDMRALADLLESKGL